MERGPSNSVPIYRLRESQKLPASIDCPDKPAPEARQTLRFLAGTPCSTPFARQIFRWRTPPQPGTITHWMCRNRVRRGEPAIPRNGIFPVHGPTVTGPLFREDVSSMLATLAFATVLSLAPAQDSQLKLTNEHTTYGFLGSTRE